MDKLQNQASCEGTELRSNTDNPLQDNRQSGHEIRNTNEKETDGCHPERTRNPSNQLRASCETTEVASQHRVARQPSVTVSDELEAANTVFIHYLGPHKRIHNQTQRQTHQRHDDEKKKEHQQTRSDVR